MKIHKIRLVLVFLACAALVLPSSTLVPIPTVGGEAHADGEWWLAGGCEGNPNPYTTAEPPPVAGSYSPYDSAICYENNPGFFDQFMQCMTLQIEPTWGQTLGCGLVGAAVIGGLTAVTGGVATLAGGSALKGALYGAGFFGAGAAAGWACACAFHIWG